MREQDAVREVAQVARRTSLHAGSTRTVDEVSTVALRTALLAATPEIELECRHALEHVGETLGADATILYSPQLGAEGWELTRCVWVGARGEQRSREFKRALDDASSSAIWDYDPLAVQAQQRNRALTRMELRASPEAQERHRQLFGALAHCDQLRALICHGPRLLAWVGVLREQPFEQRQAAVLQAQVEPLRRVLLREWNRESAALNRSLFECLLETLQRPALVLSEAGRVEAANGAASTWLESDLGLSSLAALRGAIARGTEHPGFEVIRLDARGCPGFSLVLRAGSALDSTVERAIASKSRLWGLNPRQVAVLERVAQGRSNKEIAAAIGCAEVTVERMLTRLLRLSGSRSRGELIARLHQP